METATMKSDGESMRSAVTALQHAQKRLVPMDDDPIQELWNIRQFLREQRHEVDYSPPQLWVPQPGPQTDAITTR
jgi:hypothetical protein